MEDHDRIADEALEKADRAEGASTDLKRDIEETREDWEAKQKTESVPGAIDPDQQQAEDNPDASVASGEAETGSGDSDEETEDPAG